MKRSSSFVVSSGESRSEDEIFADTPIFGSYLNNYLFGTPQGQELSTAAPTPDESAGIGPIEAFDVTINEAPILSGIVGDTAAFTEGGSAVRLDIGGNLSISDSTTNTYRSEILGLGPDLLIAGGIVGEMVPDGSGRIFIGELPGRVRIFDPAANTASVFLDVVSQTGTGGEQGFSGFALAPDFETSGTFYVFMTNIEGDNEVRRYRTMPGNPDVADPSSMDIILKIPHPAILHNGGWLGFGPDGYLYVGLGDGLDNPSDAQDPNSINGKMLRIDVNGDDFSDDPLRDYAIPDDNPFALGGGRPEVWAMGLRNPFRNSFDPVTGNLYIGDVGGGIAEEINLIRPGEGGLNFGWPNREGTYGPEPDSPDYTPPVIEYLHFPGSTAVVGGLVYRGPIEALDGQYIFGDVYSRSPGLGSFWSVPVDSLVQGSTVTEQDFTNLAAAFAPDKGLNPLLLGFRQDADGNIYFSTFGDGRIVRISNDGEANFAGGRLTVSITQNRVNAEDRLLIDTSSDTQVSLSNGLNLNSEVRVGGRLIGVIAQNGNGVGANDLVIDFTSGATLSRVETLMHAISYLNSNGDNPSTLDRTITYTLKDGFGTRGGGEDTVIATSTVTVTGVDDLPVAADDNLSTNESSTLVGNLFADNGLGSDLDVDSALSIVAVNGSALGVGSQISLASGALLTVNADGTFTYDPNHAFDNLVAPESGASNSSAVDTFTYTLLGGVSATAQISVNGQTNASNVLLGTGGSDRLDGTQVDLVSGTRGNDYLIGFAGDDNYMVESRDQVFEEASGGFDVVTAVSSFVLGAGQHVELLMGVAASLDAIELTGNELVNTIIGTAGANRIDGAAGDDFLVGLAGNDTILGGGGNDWLQGDVGNDRLEGGTGNDRLIGGAGANMLIGGAGDDTYHVEGNDMIVEEANGGFDLVYALTSFTLGAGQHVERITGIIDSLDAIVLVGNELDNALIGTAGANVLIGGAGNDAIVGGGGNDWLQGDEGNDWLEGGTGNDRLIGGAGANVLIGGAGDDTYHVEGNDMIAEDANGGFDLVYALTSFTLGAGQHVERITGIIDSLDAIVLVGNELDNALIGTAGANVLIGGAGNDAIVGGGGNDWLQGDEGNDWLEGGTGNDRLIGGAGANVLIGGAGDDTYHVEGNDVIAEEANGGFDLVYALTSFTLGGGQHVERITGIVDSLNAIDLTGNELDNVLVGTAGANTLTGGAGDDILVGLAGDDTIIGGDGNDWLQGDSGADTYIFSTALNEVNNIDRLVGFEAGVDKIALDDAIFTGLAPGALDAGAFATGSATTAAHRIIYDGTTGSLYFDVDGSGAAPRTQFAALDLGLNLSATDFVIV